MAAGKRDRGDRARATRSWPRPSTPGSGAETYFLGEVHGGDFYNRFPTECRLVGTRRWAPGNTLAAVEAEFRALLGRIAARDRLLDRARPAGSCAGAY